MEKEIQSMDNRRQIMGSKYGDWNVKLEMNNRSQRMETRMQYKDNGVWNIENENADQGMGSSEGRMEN